MYTQINVYQSTKNKFNVLIKEIKQDLKNTNIGISQIRINQSIMLELLIKHGTSGVLEEIQNLKENLKN